MERISKIKLAQWHNLNEKKLKEIRLKKLNFFEENKFF